MGGDHGGSGGTTYKGYTLHPPKRWHVVTGKGLCAVMWFWILYRAKHDGPVVLGWRHPWDGHDDHGHGHEKLFAVDSHFGPPRGGKSKLLTEKYYNGGASSSCRRINRIG